MTLSTGQMHGFLKEGISSTYATHPIFIKLLTKNRNTVAELYHYKAAKDIGDKCKDAYEKVKTYNLGKTLDEEHLRKQAKSCYRTFAHYIRKKLKSYYF